MLESSLSFLVGGVHGEFQAGKFVFIAGSLDESSINGLRLFISNLLQILLYVSVLLEEIE